MYIYNAITKTGLLIHLSMSEQHTFYILVFDIDNFKLTMKFFNNIETALAFIQEL
jgi:GGDEF domain-containing protein